MKMKKKRTEFKFDIQFAVVDKQKMIAIRNNIMNTIGATMNISIVNGMHHQHLIIIVTVKANYKTDINLTAA